MSHIKTRILVIDCYRLTSLVDSVHPAEQTHLINAHDSCWTWQFVQDTSSSSSSDTPLLNRPTGCSVCVLPAAARFDERKQCVHCVSIDKPTAWMLTCLRSRWRNYREPLHLSSLSLTPCGNRFLVCPSTLQFFWPVQHLAYQDTLQCGVVTQAGVVYFTQLMQKNKRFLICSTSLHWLYS